MHNTTVKKNENKFTVTFAPAIVARGHNFVAQLRRGGKHKNHKRYDRKIEKAVSW